MAEKKADKPNTVIVDGEEFETATVTAGKTYTLRELGVKENDEIEDASKGPDGNFNGRLNLRMVLTKSIISPPTTIDDIEKWPSKRYVIVSRVFNKLNTVQDETGNPND